MIRSLACVAAVVAAFSFAGTRADAQVVVAYSPVIAPPVPVVTYRPVYPVHTVSYSVARPVVHTVAPVAVTRTRFRPFLGRSVTRVRYGYAPVSYYGW